MGEAALQVVCIPGLPVIKEDDDLAQLIVDGAVSITWHDGSTGVADGDIFVVTSKIVSKAEGRIYPLDDFVPSPFAQAYAERTEKDPRVVEAVLASAKAGTWLPIAGA